MKGERAPGGPADDASKQVWRGGGTSKKSDRDKYQAAAVPLSHFDGGALGPPPTAGSEPSEFRARDSAFAGPQADGKLS